MVGYALALGVMCRHTQISESLTTWLPQRKPRGLAQANHTGMSSSRQRGRAEGSSWRVRWISAGEAAPAGVRNLNSSRLVPMWGSKTYQECGLQFSFLPCKMGIRTSHRAARNTNEIICTNYAPVSDCYLLFIKY